LGIGSLRDTLAAAQRTFSEWAKLPSGRTTDALMARLSATFFTLLDGVTIARSRKHIQNYYRESVVQLGGFPKRMPPRPIYPEIDTRGSFMPYDAIIFSRPIGLPMRRPAFVTSAKPSARPISLG
jgi:hypothetical protein